MSWVVTIPTADKNDFADAVAAVTLEPDHATLANEQQLAAAKKALLGLFKSKTLDGGKFSATLGGHYGAISVSIHGY